MADTRTATGVCYTISGSEKRYEDKISIEIVKGTTTLPTIKNDVITVANENHYSFDADENCVYKSKGEKDETLPLIFVTYYPNKGQNPVYFNYDQYCIVKIKVNLVMPPTSGNDIKYIFDKPENVKIKYNGYNTISLKDARDKGIKVPYGSGLTFDYENCIDILNAGDYIIGQYVYSTNIVDSRKVRLIPLTTKGEIYSINSIIEYNIKYHNATNVIIKDDNYNSEYHEHPGYYVINSDREINLYVGFSKFFIEPEWRSGNGNWFKDEWTYNNVVNMITTNINNSEQHNTFPYNSSSGFGGIDVTAKADNYISTIGAKMVCSIYPHYINPDHWNEISNYNNTDHNYFVDIPVSNGIKIDSTKLTNGKNDWMNYNDQQACSNDDAKNIFREFPWKSILYGSHSGDLNISQCPYLYANEYNPSEATEEFGNISLGNAIVGTGGKNDGDEGNNKVVIAAPTCWYSYKYGSYYTNIPKYGIIVGFKTRNAFVTRIGVNIGQVSIGGCIAKPISFLTSEKELGENYAGTNLNDKDVQKAISNDSNQMTKLINEYWTPGTRYYSGTYGTFGETTNTKYGGMLVGIALAGYRKNVYKYRFEMFFVNIRNSKYNLKHALETWNIWAQ